MNFMKPTRTQSPHRRCVVILKSAACEQDYECTLNCLEHYELHKCARDRPGVNLFGVECGLCQVAEYVSKTSCTSLSPYTASYPLTLFNIDVSRKTDGMSCVYY